MVNWDSRLRGIGCWKRIEENVEDCWYVDERGKSYRPRALMDALCGDVRPDYGFFYLCIDCAKKEHLEW